MKAQTKEKGRVLQPTKARYAPYRETVRTIRSSPAPIVPQSNMKTKQKRSKNDENL